MSPSHELAATPIADRLIELAGQEIVSFHALPISRAGSVRKSVLFDKYQKLFGDEFLKTDVTFTGSIFDSPILPKKLIKDSQNITAQAFGSKHTLYITMGTTVANFIAINSLTDQKDRVLVDKACHQSVHFANLKNHNDVCYVHEVFTCESTGRSHFDVERFIETYARAHAEGRPFKLVIINGSSYDGVIYDIKHILRECLLIHDDVSFLIDEAWSSFGFFHPYYKRFSAMQVAAELQAEMPDKNVCVVATQSAHKSLSCLRQGSYLHIFAPDDVIARFQSNKFAAHTTSPSYPILASLELARAQAVLEGYHMVEHSLRTADLIRYKIMSDQRLSAYKLNDDSFIDHGSRKYIYIDPLRVSINLSSLQVSPALFKEFAFNQHRVYVNRHTDQSVLFNIHIGIQPEDGTRLLNALIDFQQCVQESLIAEPEAAEGEASQLMSEHLYKMYADFRAEKSVGDICDAYVIPYPPGVPILFPGDLIDEEVLGRVDEIEKSNIDILVIKSTGDEEKSFRPNGEVVL